MRFDRFTASIITATITTTTTTLIVVAVVVIILVIISIAAGIDIVEGWCYSTGARAREREG